MSSKNKGITNEETKNYEEKKTKQQTTAVEKKKGKNKGSAKAWTRTASLLGNLLDYWATEENTEDCVKNIIY